MKLLLLLLLLLLSVVVVVHRVLQESSADTAGPQQTPDDEAGEDDDEEERNEDEEADVGVDPAGVPLVEVGVVAAALVGPGGEGVADDDEERGVDDEEKPGHGQHAEVTPPFGEDGGLLQGEAHRHEPLQADEDLHGRQIYTHCIMYEIVKVTFNLLSYF